jgi:hypothetical protein
MDRGDRDRCEGEWRPNGAVTLQDASLIHGMRLIIRPKSRVEVWGIAINDVFSITW